MRPRLHIDRLRENPLYREMLASHRRAAEEHERAQRRAFALCVLSFFFWTGVVVATTSWGMGTVRWAHLSRTIIEVGLLVGALGILGTLLFASAKLGR